jgi:hypothetical protein
MRRVGVIVDAATGSTTDIPVRPEFTDLTVEDRPPCRPFGITWHREECYIANHRQLLVFDRSFDYLRTESVPLQVNVHQLAYHAGHVWVASPWTNSLIGIAPAGGDQHLEFHPMKQVLGTYLPRESAEADDLYHVNCLLWAGDDLFVVAHNRGKPSYILNFDADTFRLKALRYDVGAAVHGLAFHEGELYWISTKTQELCSTGAFHMPLSRRGFARGFALTEDYVIVAISEHRTRMDRAGGDSWIQVIDRRTRSVLAEHHLPGTGSINDLRVLDEFDYAHGLEPFLATRAVA